MYITWFCYIWRVVVLSFIPSTPKLVNFLNFLESRSWGKNMPTPKLVNFQHFWIPGVEKKHVYMYIYNMYICTYVYYMNLLYLEGSGSKFHSVSTKTSQFCQFFGVQELRKKHVNTKTSQFPPFFGFQELTKKYVNTKTSQFSPFLDSRSWEKTCMYIYIICIFVHMYITWFCYIWRVVVLNFIPSTPKLVNFLHFLDSRNWEKTCVYIICIYVHMYITWFCYIWRVVVLSFIPSTPKLINFANF